MSEEQTRINKRFNREFDEQVRVKYDGAVRLATVDFSQAKVYKARQRESRAALRNISGPIILLSGSGGSLE